jgi:hypothetical protein
MAECIASWKSAEKARVERNNSRRAQHKEALKVWEQNRDAAKQEAWEFKDKKPKPERIGKPVPRPKPTDFIEEADQGALESEDDEDDNKQE